YRDLPCHCGRFVSNHTQAASCRIIDSGNFHDRRWSCSIDVHQKVASVEGAQCRTMTDAKYRRGFKSLANQSINARFSGLIQRRGGLIEKEPIGFLHESTSKCDALLFSRRELERPVPTLVKALGKMGETHCFQGLAQCHIVNMVACHRITYHFAECANR